MSSSYEETFYIVPSYIRKLSGMTLGYMDVYNIIFQFWNKGRQCFLKNEVFMERTGYTEQYIRKAFAFFEKHNELERVPHGGKRYLVQPQKKIEIDCEQAVDKKVDPKLQFPLPETTVSPYPKLQFREPPDKTPSKPLKTKGVSELSFPLNKQTLNKELKNNNKGAVVVLKIVEEANKVGVEMNEEATRRLVTKYPTEYVLEKIKALKKTSGVSNPTAWLSAALKNNYKTPSKQRGTGQLKGEGLSLASHEYWTESIQQKRNAAVRSDPNDEREIMLKASAAKNGIAMLGN